MRDPEHPPAREGARGQGSRPWRSKRETGQRRDLGQMSRGQNAPVITRGRTCLRRGGAADETGAEAGDVRQGGRRRTTRRTTPPPPLLLSFSNGRRRSVRSRKDPLSPSGSCRSALRRVMEEEMEKEWNWTQSAHKDSNKNHVSDGGAGNMKGPQPLRQCEPGGVGLRTPLPPSPGLSQPLTLRPGI